MPFTPQFTESTDGLKLYYREYTSQQAKAGIDVLCLPGLTRSSKDFADLAEHLSANHRVICPDLRGRGESGYAKDPSTYVPIQYVKDLKIVMAAASIERCVIIGTSLGGILAMTMAGTMRHRLAGVVLNDVGPEIDPKGVARIQGYVGKGGPVNTWEEAVAATRDINLAAFPDFTDAQWLKMAQELYADRDGKIRPNYDPDISKPFAAGSTTAAPSMWPFFEALVGLPTLLIRGETSDILSLGTAAAMQAQHPSMKRIDVPGVGHAPTLRESDARTAIDDFLKDIPVKQGVIAWLKSRWHSLQHILRITKALKANAQPKSAA